MSGTLGEGGLAKALAKLSYEVCEWSGIRLRLSKKKKRERS